jgi:hypothetical protein
MPAGVYLPNTVVTMPSHFQVIQGTFS